MENSLVAALVSLRGKIVPFEIQTSDHLQRASKLIEEYCQGKSLDLPVPRLSAPKKVAKTSNGLQSNVDHLSERIQTISTFIQSFMYNYRGDQANEEIMTLKTKRLANLYTTARQILDASLPIKCLEACALGVYLTKDIDGLIRFPIRFKTEFTGFTHKASSSSLSVTLSPTSCKPVVASASSPTFWHIVCGLYAPALGRYGSLGLSRRSSLGGKPLEFNCLSSLIASYVEAYNTIGHCVRKIIFGLPVGVVAHSQERVYWHFLHMETHQTQLPIQLKPIPINESSSSTPPLPSSPPSSSSSSSTEAAPMVGAEASNSIVVTAASELLQTEKQQQKGQGQGVPPTSREPEMKGGKKEGWTIKRALGNAWWSKASVTMNEFGRTMVKLGEDIQRSGKCICIDHTYYDEETETLVFSPG